MTGSLPFSVFKAVFREVMMKRRMICFSEAAYVFGMILLALGTAFMEKADFGMSMVVAPAYLLHLKISQYIPGFTFGMAEYVLQAVLILCLSVIMRRLKKGYLFSFVTAVLYGFILDFCISLVNLMPFTGIPFRVICFALGMIMCTAGVAFLFHTYISPEAYELFVKEISEKYHLEIGRVKTVYDLTSCLISVLLSFLFFGFGHFEAVKAGTFVCALFNGWLIAQFSGLYDRTLEFRDALPYRRVFEQG